MMVTSKNRPDKPQPTVEDVVNGIFVRSGNTFHCKVANHLESKGWTTRMSQYYVDATTDKAREIDLIAEKVWEFGDKWQQKWVHLHIQLFIECKYVSSTQPNHVVFWFDKVDPKGLATWIDRHPPFESKNKYSSSQL